MLLEVCNAHLGDFQKATPNKIIRVHIRFSYMRYARIFILTIIAALGLIISSCISDEISTSSSDLLTFSTDTLSFDTVFTDLGTPTARLLVYNRNKKGVNISSIRFKNPESHFQLNVDGMSGSDFHDVEIRGKDSIYVFVECFIPESDNNEPYLIEDDLIFVTNGVEQKVKVEAYGQNVTRLRGVTITDDTRFTTERPYVVFDSLIVAEGVTLSIDPGVKLLFHDKAKLTINGSLKAIGEPGKMIDMRGDRLDNVLPDVGYDILAGQWDGIRFTAASFDNALEYVDMRSTVSGIKIDSCGNLDRTKLLLRNSWLHNSQSTVLDSRYAKVDAYGVCFSEAAEAVVRLTGGSHDFTQCTISNYYLFAAITEPLLSLYHIRTPEGDDTPYNPEPLMKANFNNCIIYGLGTDINEGDLTGTDIYLRHVLLKSEGTDDDNFINCLWGEDPLFYTIRTDYYFNYRLRTDSPAIGAGDPTYVNELSLYDMDGLNRLSDGNPALGAFVFVPEETTEAYIGQRARLRRR